MTDRTSDLNWRRHPKTHYGMSAEMIAARAPFTTKYCEEPVHCTDYPSGNTHFELRTGYRVIDKSGDTISRQYPTEQACHSCVEELNLVAAKWLMENEGPPISNLEDEDHWKEINRYRK